MEPSKLSEQPMGSPQDSLWSRLVSQEVDRRRHAERLLVACQSRLAVAEVTVSALEANLLELRRQNERLNLTLRFVVSFAFQHCIILTTLGSMGPCCMLVIRK